MNNLTYFRHEENEERAINYWNNSQFDLTDIVLYLTDKGINIGIKIYALFHRKEIRNLMRFFCCDFANIKQELKIGEYVDRSGDIYSKMFNPKRKSQNNELTLKELEIIAEEIYHDLMTDLKIISNDINKKHRF